MAKANSTEVTFSKVYKAALESKYHGVSVNNLLSVIYATSSPEVAMEMLLDIYEQPVLEQFVKDNTNNVKLSFISYNAFEREVLYSYLQNKKVNIYIDADVDTNEITSENYQDYKKSWDNTRKSFTVTLPEMETVCTTMNLSSWEKCQKWHDSSVETVQYCLED